MKKDEKIWGVLAHLSGSMWGKKENICIDDEFWNFLLEESAKSGINTIVLDIGDGIKFASHPEIALPDAWSRKRVRREVQRCKDLGIALIPKLNFSTGHDHWLGDYHRMTSTNIYYQLCNDLIHEVYNLFDKPEYIHLGLDEEDARHCAGRDLAVFRQGELYWNDVNFLNDCVHDTGATPWIWSCPLLRHPDEYKAHVDPEDAVISPWYYHSLSPDKNNWTPISSWQDYIDYYSKEPYKSMNLTYVEEDPYNAMCREHMLPLLLEKGYKYIPCASTFYNVDRNTMDLVEYFKTNAPDELILGYMTAPWMSSAPNDVKMAEFKKSFKFLKEAREKWYGI